MREWYEMVSPRKRLTKRAASGISFEGILTTGLSWRIASAMLDLPALPMIL